MPWAFNYALIDVERNASLLIAERGEAVHEMLAWQECQFPVVMTLLAECGALPLAHVGLLH
jgi:hypothetical protein